jgi:hypothetical protein
MSSITSECDRGPLHVVGGMITVSPCTVAPGTLAAMARAISTAVESFG